MYQKKKKRRAISIQKPIHRTDNVRTVMMTTISDIIKHVPKVDLVYCSLCWKRWRELSN